MGEKASQNAKSLLFPGEIQPFFFNKFSIDFLKFWLTSRVLGKLSLTFGQCSCFYGRVNFQMSCLCHSRSASSGYFYFKRHKALNNVGHSYEKQPWSIPAIPNMKR